MGDYLPQGRNGRSEMAKVRSGDMDFTMVSWKKFWRGSSQNSPREGKERQPEYRHGSRCPIGQTGK